MSMRYEAKPGSGNRPRIFFYEEPVKKEKVKFGYKKKANRFPLRNKEQVTVEEKKAKAPADKTKTFKARPAPSTTKPLESKTSKAGTVTLTENQLQTILDLIVNDPRDEEAVRKSMEEEKARKRAPSHSDYGTDDGRSPRRSAETPPRRDSPPRRRHSPSRRETDTPPRRRGLSPNRDDSPPRRLDFATRSPSPEPKRTEVPRRVTYDEEMARRRLEAEQASDRDNRKTNRGRDTARSKSPGDEAHESIHGHLRKEPGNQRHRRHKSENNRESRRDDLRDRRYRDDSPDLESDRRQRRQASRRGSPPRDRDNRSVRESRSAETPRDPRARRRNKPRSLSPDEPLPRHSTPPEEEVKLNSQLPPKPMTLAERKRLQWEKDKLTSKRLQLEVELLRKDGKKTFLADTDDVKNVPKQETSHESPRSETPETEMVPSVIHRAHMTKAERLRMERDLLARDQEKTRRNRISSHDEKFDARDERDTDRRSKRRSSSQGSRERNDERESHRDKRRRERREDDRRERRDRSHDRYDQRDDRHNERRRSPSPQQDSSSLRRRSGSRERSPRETYQPPLTLIEKKRAEWKRQLEPDAYDPWGKPGAGAPLRTQSGQVRADYGKDRQDKLRESRSDKDGRGDEETNNIRSRRPHNYRDEEDRGGRHENTDAAPVYTNRQPAAIRSSFVLGAAAPNAGRFDSTKEDEKKKWLEDLDRQREEKRRQKEREAEAQRRFDEKWSTTIVQPDPVPAVNEQDNVVAAPGGGRISVAPQERSKSRNEGDGTARAPESEVWSTKKFYPKQQFSSEEERHTAIQNEQRSRERQMEETIKQFEMEAKKVKHEERLKRLRRAGHDISKLRASFESEEQQLSARIDQSRMDTVRTVEPTHIPGLSLTPTEGLSPRRDLATQTVMDRYDQPRDPPERSTRQESELHIEYQLPPEKPAPPQTRFSAEPNLQELEDEERRLKLALMNTRQQQKLMKKQQELEKELLKKERKPKPEEEEEKQRKFNMKNRPGWGYNNQRGKRYAKQSDRDPLARQKRERRERLKEERTRKLMDMIEQNADRIPGGRAGKPKNPLKNTHTLEERPPPAPKHTQQAERVAAGSVLRGAAGSVARGGAESVRRDYDYLHVSARGDADTGRETNYDMYRQQDNATVTDVYEPSLDTRRLQLAAVESVRGAPSRRTVAMESQRSSKRGDEFVPFLRTSEVLDPAQADAPLPVSREATAVTNARKAYIQNFRPAEYGDYMVNRQDRPAEEIYPPKFARADPITNPELVTDHPTQRQETILQQLGMLRKNLLQKRQEIETFYTASEQALPQQQ